MNSLFDALFEVTPEIEILAKNLWKSFDRYNGTGYGWAFGKAPVSYTINYDSFTNPEYEYEKNKYNWGLIVTRKDESKIFLYYNKNQPYPDIIRYGYIDITIDEFKEDYFNSFVLD